MPYFPSKQSPFKCVFSKTYLPFNVLDTIHNHPKDFKESNSESCHSSSGNESCKECSEQKNKLDELLRQEAFSGYWGSWDIINNIIINKQEFSDSCNSCNSSVTTYGCHDECDSNNPNQFINSIGEFISRYGFKNKKLIESEREYIEFLKETGSYPWKDPLPTYEELVNSKRYKEVITMINFHRYYANKKYKMLRRIIIKEYKFINSIYGVNNKYTNKIAYEKFMKKNDYSISRIKIFNCDCKYHSMLTMYGKPNEYFGSIIKGYTPYKGLNLPYYITGDEF